MTTVTRSTPEMTSRRWFVLPSALRSALAVAVLGLFVAALIVSGGSGRSGVRVAADSRPAPAAASHRSVAALPDVADALSVLSGGRSAVTQRASRSARRVALSQPAAPSPHRWV